MATEVASCAASGPAGSIDIQTLAHPADGRTFTTVDHGAGDNTYGAIFTDPTADIATAIHDGDFYRCSVN